MDPLVAIGLATAVVTFIDFGAQVVKRLEELSKAGGLPKAFQDVRNRLPIISGIITRAQSLHQELPWATQYELENIIKDCSRLVREVQDIIDKVTVVDGDSKFRKVVKAVASLPQETRVTKIAAQLSDYVSLLMALNIMHVEKDIKPEKERRATEAPPPAYADTLGNFIVPFKRDDNFVGREKVLEEIECLFEKHKRVSVAGMGGIGKSQVAIEIAYRYKTINPNAHVFWVYGGTIARFYQGYKLIARKLELPSWDDPDVSILELVSTWFQETTESFLLIVDNADDIYHYWPGKYKNLSSLNEPETNLSQYLPQSAEGNGRMLVTTRDRRIAEKLSKPCKPIAIEAMAPEEARRLFLLHVDNDYEDEESEALDNLVSTLDCLPLSITQAASFIEENSITIAEYLEALHNDDAEEFLNEELYDCRRDEESVSSTFRTLKISLDSISKQKPKAAELLSLLCVLDRQSIPRWILNVPEAKTSVGLLCSFHLITLRSGSNSIQLHRMVQSFMQCYLKRAHTLDNWRAKALSCISQAYPTEIGVGEHAVCDALAPHVQTVIGYDYRSTEARLELAHLLCWAADFDIERGMYVQALSRAKRSLDIFRELVAPTDERLAASTWLYGRLLYYEAKSQSDLHEAELVLRQALSISEPHTLNYAESAFELAHLFYSQDKEKECLEMGKASFESWKGMEGDRSVRTLDNMHDYALELAMFGHEEEAIANWQTIVDKTPSSDASENTKNVYTLRSLAGIAEFRADSTTAEQLYNKLIELCSELYGPDHIHVFDYRLSHAEQILRQGRTEEAARLSKDMLGSCQNKSEWRIMLSCYEIMAECYKQSGDTGQEESHRLKCLDIWSKYLGDNHKESISAAAAAATCLVKIGKSQEAARLLSKVLDWRKLHLGEKHRDTVDTLEYLGICKVQQSSYQEAERFFAQAVECNEGDKPRWLLSLANLCISLYELQNWSLLESKCREALESQTPYDGDTRQMMVESLERQGKTTEAIAYKAQSLEIHSEDRRHISSARRVREPCSEHIIERRFGRIIHPRTWSA